MRARRWLENFLLLAGVLALDVWIWSHAGAVIFQMWQDRALDREINSNVLPGETPAGPAATKSGGALGRLVIPRLRLRAVVCEGTGEDTLSLALGHIPSTSLPGEPGNVGIAGHRDTIFRALRDIRKNDLIVFETRAGRFAYRVEGMEIVKPTQVSVLKAGRARELTLVTCYPFRYVGSAPDRFIVKARQVVRNSTPVRLKTSGA
jgi:sortase A